MASDAGARNSGGDSAESPGWQETLARQPIERLREMGRALGADVPRRILELFLSDAPQRLTKLRDGLASGDTEGLEQAAHSLKGSSANLGASALADLCHDIEQQCRDRTGPVTGQQLSLLEAEYTRVEKAMQQLMVEFP